MNEIEILQALNGEVQTPLHWTKDEQNKAIDAAISALEAQQTDRWIPIRCKADNPLQNGEYQVTVIYENFSGVYIKTLPASCRGGEWNIYGSQPVITNRRIIAYKPLNEPWEEVQP